MPVFKTGAINRSATSPGLLKSYNLNSFFSGVAVGAQRSDVLQHSSKLPLRVITSQFSAGPPVYIAPLENGSALRVFSH
jgi:hypothetical protein